ncbi:MULTISPECIES: GNAT family N-acetyltransferase [Streptomyces]|uniref:GNAT family N-acetyltransferase n=1 Tax=Streptomyces koelreuteriae TaxID=2838015 RepID=A0ABX8FXC3_9ACTN|nr:MULTISPECIES: GNAT family N-acetyltransferase [Streptomyces]QWB25865.1 GNAT family N-acetyltransferase [Streptomyces koelreuteriae]UUA08925.1 GNAT family N-acetyltransferase [Streptomyces koelreuteriae]UUA16530.1 GNAT family N-acetyltransferase [Streptomyces sp. CRCS-T-1]
MSSVRRALPEDAEEVLRLRQIMIESLFASDTSTRWHGESLPTLKAELGKPEADFVAFVVDHPERPGALASLVAGTIDYRIGKSGDPQGKVGFVFSVATDTDARRRGYARACMQTLLEWFRTRGARRVQLTASPEAEPLYVSLGFRPKPDPLLELTL